MRIAVLQREWFYTLQEGFMWGRAAMFIFKGASGSCSVVKGFRCFAFRYSVVLGCGLRMADFRVRVRAWGLGRRAKAFSFIWVAVKELKLSYHNGYIYIYSK